jgi:N-acetylmuramoyl-L-alanine amidase
MLRHLRILLPLTCLASVVWFVASCESTSPRSGGWQSRLGKVPVDHKVTPVAMLQEVNLKQDMIKKGTAGRRTFRPMNVRYITIHSTQNPTGDAYKHALALKRGALRATKRRGGNRIGFLTWHFTVQDNVAIQHLPTNEQGEHADFDGPGNNYSIGIEMCEHRGNDIARTIDKTARLAAFLMYEHNLPISRVVPHYHWPRRGASPPNKDCPHFLLDNGRPGATWRWFLSRVEAHHSRLVAGPVPRI